MVQFFLFTALLLVGSTSALTEKEFIQSLLDNNAFFEKENINLAIKKIEFQGDKDNYENWDWSVSAELVNISKNRYKHNYTSSTDYARSTNQFVRKTSTKLTKRFFDDGSRLSISYSKSLPTKDEQMYDKKGYQTDKNTTEHLNDASISWSLPLLKNQGGIIEQKTYDLAILDYEDEKLVLAEAQEGFIENKLMIFFDWISY